MSRATGLPLVFLSALVAMLLTVLVWPQQVCSGTLSSNALAQIDLRPALPTSAELPGFETMQVTTRYSPRHLLGAPNASTLPLPQGAVILPQSVAPPRIYPENMGINVVATRSSDGLRLNLSMAVTQTSAEAQELTNLALSMCQSRMPQGTLSGQPIGQHVWETALPHQPVRGAFTLYADDGRSFISVDMLQHIPSKRVDGKPVFPVFTQSDLILGETLARNCLTRLGYMGYTSHSTLPLAARKAFIQKRLAMLRHTTRKPAA